MNPNYQISRENRPDGSSNSIVIILESINTSATSSHTLALMPAFVTLVSARRGEVEKVVDVLSMKPKL